MSTILIVDDRPINREFLKSLFTYKGYQVIEANDGAEALGKVRADHPDLVISDILMPTMDGFEFVRQLRADPNTADTPVIFSSAHYLERESRRLAHASGITAILTKPCEPETILRVVEEALRSAPAKPSHPTTEEFDRGHLKVVTDKLSEKTDQLRLINLRLSELIKVAQQISIESGPSKIVEEYCDAARNIIGAEYAGISILDRDGIGIQQSCVRGFPGDVSFDSIQCKGIFAEIVTQRRSRRVRNESGNPLVLGFPANFPRVISFLGAPVCSTSEVLGWVWLANKISEEEFVDHEEQLITTLATQLAASYENTKIFAESRGYAEALERELKDRKQAEQALWASEERYRTLAETANDAIFIAGLDGDIQYINTTGAQLFGASPGEVVGKSQAELFPADLAEAHLQMFQAVRETSRPYYDENWRIFQDHKLWQSTWLSPIKNAAGEVYAVMGIARDETKRKEAEESLSFAALIVRSSDDAIIGKAIDGTILSWNKGAEKMYGYRADEIEGQNIRTIVPPDRTDETMHLVERIMRGDVIEHFETVRQKKDGNLIDVALTISPIRDNDGGVAAISIIARDITERRRTQEAMAKAHSMILEAAQMKSEFLCNMSHEFRTPMNGIIGMTDLLLDTNVTLEQQNYLEMVRSSANLLMTIITDILDFADCRSGRIDLKPVSFCLEESVRQTMNSFAARAERKRLEFTYEQAQDIPEVVRGDCSKLKQVLNKLIDNAVKFTSSGEVALRVERVSDSENSICLHFSVADTGLGIPTDKQATVFAAFSQCDGSATRKYGGTGMGLPLSRQLIELMDGTLWMESEEGQGSTFHFNVTFGTDASTDCIV